MMEVGKHCLGRGIRHTRRYVSSDENGTESAAEKIEQSLE
jgi:hypothetical protein